jgi:hypothetical protein
MIPQKVMPPVYSFKLISWSIGTGEDEFVFPFHKTIFTKEPPKLLVKTLQKMFNFFF